MLYNCVMTNYAQTLREHNLKVTPQRLAITDVLYMKGHSNIDSLYESMLKKFDSISLATIYKNINLMLENTFIEEVKIPNAKSVYELKKSSHSHLVCKSCACVEDIGVSLENVFLPTPIESGFVVESSSLIFSGTCHNCQ